MHAKVKATDMTEWAIYLFKLAVLRDLFEIQEIGRRLREYTDFEYGNPAIGQYFKGVRKPPADFFDYVRLALDLTDEEYQTVLFLYHRSQSSPSPLQQEQMRHFRNVLLVRMIKSLQGEQELGELGTAG